MNTHEIKQILHQREPYLMVSEVINLEPRKITTRKIHEGDEAHIKGHFPDLPVVPGAMLQEVATQSAGILISKFYSPIENYSSTSNLGLALGVLSRVDKAKFLSPVSPFDDIVADVELLEHLENRFLFKSTIMQDDKVCAKIMFRLINVPEQSLRKQN